MAFLFSSGVPNFVTLESQNTCTRCVFGGLGRVESCAEEEVQHPSAFHTTYCHRTPDLPFNNVGLPAGNLVIVCSSGRNGEWGVGARQKRGLWMGLEQKRTCSWKLSVKKHMKGTFPRCGHSGPVAVQDTEALGNMRLGAVVFLRGQLCPLRSSQTHHWEQQNTGSIIIQFWSTQCQDTKCN